MRPGWQRSFRRIGAPPRSLADSFGRPSILQHDLAGLTMADDKHDGRRSCNTKRVPLPLERAIRARHDHAKTRKNAEPVSIPRLQTFRSLGSRKLLSLIDKHETPTIRDPETFGVDYESSRKGEPHKTHDTVSDQVHYRLYYPRLCISYDLAPAITSIQALPRPDPVHRVLLSLVLSLGLLCFLISRLAFSCPFFLLGCMQDVGSSGMRRSALPARPPPAHCRGTRQSRPSRC